jgi:hypothetical protein
MRAVFLVAPASRRRVSFLLPIRKTAGGTPAPPKAIFPDAESAITLYESVLSLNQRKVS